MSIDNLDPELRPFLDTVLEFIPGYDAERLGEMRAGLRTVIDTTPLVRPVTVQVEDVTVPGPSGDPDVAMRIYRPTTVSDPIAALYWMHGGGMMIGSMDMDDALLVGAVEKLGIAIVSVEYRLAPEHPDPAPSRIVMPVWCGPRHTRPTMASTPIASPSVAPVPEGGWRRARPCSLATEEGRDWPCSSFWSRCSMIVR
jgi:hypothetical protein